MKSLDANQPVAANARGSSIAPVSGRRWSLSSVLVVMIGIVNIVLGAFLLYMFLDLQSTSFSRNEGFDLFLPLLVMTLCLVGWFLVYGLFANIDRLLIPSAIFVIVAGAYLLYIYLPAQIDRLALGSSFDFAVVVGLMAGLLFLTSPISILIGKAWPRRLILVLSAVAAISYVLAAILLTFGAGPIGYVLLTIGLAVSTLLVAQAWPRIVITTALIFVALDLTLDIVIVAKGDTLSRLLLITASVACIISAIGLIRLREWGRATVIGLYTVGCIVGFPLMGNNPGVLIVITLLIVFLVVILESESVFTENAG